MEIQKGNSSLPRYSPIDEFIKNCRNLGRIGGDYGEYFALGKRQAGLFQETINSRRFTLRHSQFEFHPDRLPQEQRVETGIVYPWFIRPEDQTGQICTVNSFPESVLT